MNAPLSDERLAEIRRRLDAAPSYAICSSPDEVSVTPGRGCNARDVANLITWASHDIRDLLAEVERLRELLAARDVGLTPEEARAVEGRNWTIDPEQQERLRTLAVRCFGWGPVEGEIAFEREGRGWRVGNGVCVTVWEGREVPDDPAQALREIEAAAVAEALEIGDSPIKLHNLPRCSECEGTGGLPGVSGQRWDDDTQSWVLECILCTGTGRQAC